MNLTLFHHAAPQSDSVNLLIRLKNKIPYALHTLSGVVNPSPNRKILTNSCSVPVDKVSQPRVSLICKPGLVQKCLRKIQVK
jgi:hypothetical protein